MTDQPTLGCTLQDDEPGKCCQFRRPCAYAYPLGWPHEDSADLNAAYSEQRRDYAAALQASRAA